MAIKLLEAVIAVVDSIDAYYEETIQVVVTILLDLTVNLLNVLFVNRFYTGPVIVLIHTNSKIIIIKVVITIIWKSMKIQIM